MLGMSAEALMYVDLVQSRKQKRTQTTSILPPNINLPTYKHPLPSLNGETRGVTAHRYPGGEQWGLGASQVLLLHAKLDLALQCVAAPHLIGEPMPNHPGSCSPAGCQPGTGPL